MGRGANTWIALGVGVIFAALAIVSLGTLAPALGAVWVTLFAGIAFSAASYGATALLGGPGGGGLPTTSQDSSGRSGNRTTANADQLQIATTSDNFPVPIIFGRVRLPGNIIRYDRNTFRNEAIKQESPQPNITINTGAASSGKGGGGGGSAAPKSEKPKTIEQIIGFNYFLSFEYAVCMGPLDYFKGMISNPGETVLSEDSHAFSTMDPATITIDVAKGEGGIITLYPGGADQTRGTDTYSSGQMNYRNVVWAMFDDYLIGTSAVPKTYLLELVRWPKALDAAGDPIDGFQTTGSADSGHPCFWDANPAACMWEILTNQLWGRGLDHSLLDQDSFVAASQFFYDNDIGMSFSVDTQGNLSSLIDSIRNHVNTVLIWNGEVLKCKVLQDPETSYADVIAIDASMVQAPEFNRPGWPTTFNELKIEYTDRETNYQPETLQVQDMANIQTVGTVNSKRISLRAFSNRETASIQALRILRDLSYPLASLSFKMNRFASKLEPGDFVRFDWDDWADGSVTSFWRVVTVEDGEQDQDGIRVMLIEDYNAVTFLGEPDEFELPVPGYLNASVLTNADTNLENPQDAFIAGDIEPLAVREQVPAMTGGAQVLSFFAQRRNGFILALQLYWRPVGTTAWTLYAVKPCFATAGELTADIGTTRQIERRPDHVIEFTIEHAADEGAMLGSANKVGVDADDMETLLRLPTDFLLIGEELIQVGMIDGGPTYEATNYLRGAYGTPITDHTTGDVVYYIRDLGDAFFSVENTTIPNNLEVEFRARALTFDGPSDDYSTAFQVPYSSGKLQAIGARPYPPSLYDVTGSGPRTIRIRPRLVGEGAGVLDLETMLNGGSAMGLTFKVQHWDGLAALDTPAPAVSSYTEADQSDPETGLVEITDTLPIGTTETRIWAVDGTWLSRTPLVVPV